MNEEQPNEHIEKLSMDSDLYNIAKRCGSNITSCVSEEAGPCGGNGHVCGTKNSGSCSSLVTCRPTAHTHCSALVGGCNLYVGGCGIDVHCPVPI